MPARGQYKKGAKADSVRQREYNSKPEQKKRRAQRNASRRKMEKAGKVRKGDGKDVDHRNHNTADQSSKNLGVISKSKKPCNEPAFKTEKEVTNFTLPRDNNNDIIQALSLSDNVTNGIDNSAQVRFTLPSDTAIVRIAAASNCYIKFGDSSVVATTNDILFPQGAEVFSIKGKGYTHISILGTDVASSPASVTKNDIMFKKIRLFFHSFILQKKIKYGIAKRGRTQ